MPESHAYPIDTHHLFRAIARRHGMEKRCGRGVEAALRHACSPALVQRARYAPSIALSKPCGLSASASMSARDRYRKVSALIIATASLARPAPDPGLLAPVVVARHARVGRPGVVVGNQRDI